MCVTVSVCADMSQGPMTAPLLPSLQAAQGVRPHSHIQLQCQILSPAATYSHAVIVSCWTEKPFGMGLAAAHLGDALGP